MRALLAHRLARNVGWLFLFQLSTYLSFLLVIPWLTHALPVGEYGAVMAVMAAAQFCFIVTDYGFTNSATYEVACHRADATRVQDIIAQVHGAKVWLVALSWVSLWLLSRAPSYQAHEVLFLYAGLAVLFQAYQPVWLLQGLENMRAYAMYMVMVRVSFMAGVYTVVRAPGDGALVMLIFMVSNLLGMVLGIRSMRTAGYRAAAVSLIGGIRLMRSSAGYFWGRLAFALYSSLNSVVLGATSLTQAGIFNVAEQIYKAGQSLGGPVSQAMLPALAQSRNSRLIWKILPALIGVIGLGCALVAVLASWIVELAFGPGYGASVSVLYVFLIIIPITIAEMVLGYPWFAALGSPGLVNTTSVLSAGLHVLLLGLLWWNDALTAYNVALCVLTTESFMLLLRVGLGWSLTRAQRAR
ncbi:hypothetical protein CDEN61S_01034 [Castellaniella denitrificans]|uniref:oligosaccharide flippase family protein n=1 Tax=Castellaniella sp. TaxID=1955812 RepID=UPI003D096BAE